MHSDIDMNSDMSAMAMVTMHLPLPGPTRNPNRKQDDDDQNHSRAANSDSHSDSAPPDALHRRTMQSHTHTHTHAHDIAHAHRGRQRAGYMRSQPIPSLQTSHHSILLPLLAIIMAWTLLSSLLCPLPLPFSIPSSHHRHDRDHVAIDRMSIHTHLHTHAQTHPHLPSAESTSTSTFTLTRQRQRHLHRHLPLNFHFNFLLSVHAQGGGGGTCDGTWSCTWSACTPCPDYTKTPSCTCTTTSCCATKPTITSCGSCTPTSCSYGPWSLCSMSCGDAVQTRSATCKYSDGTTAALSSCTGSCSSTTQSCNLGSCYAWDIGAYGACNPSCGYGSQTRIVVCKDQRTGGVVADSYCGTKPPISQSCIAQHCYAWQHSTWGACSRTCSSGFQSRSVWCQDTTAGVSVSDGYCTGSKPASQQDCYTACTNNYLQSFAVSGALSFSPAFTAATLSYTAVMPYTATSATASASQQDPTATLTWNVQSVSGLTYGSSKTIQVTVRSQAGVDRVYQCSVTRQPSPINTLSALSVSGAVTFSPPFSSNTDTYSAVVPYTQSSATGAASLTDSRAKLTWQTQSVTDLMTSTAKYIQVTVRSESGSEMAYSVAVTRQLSPINTLDSFTVAGCTDWSPSTFSSSTTAYLCQVPFSMSSASGSATLTDSHASMSWNPQTVTGLLYPMRQRIQVTVTSEFGTSRLYYVDVQRAPSNNASLHSFTPSDGSINPTFDPDITSYALNLPNTVSSVTMSAVQEDTTAVMSWNPSPPTQSSIPVAPDTRTITAIVGAQDGTTIKTYTVTITRARSSNAQLSALSVVPIGSSATLNPVFSSLTYSYDLSDSLGAAVTSIELSATPEDETATLKYRLNDGAWINIDNSGSNHSISIPQGNSAVDVLCTAQDGLTASTYRVSFYKLSSDATLSSLTVSVGSLTPVFSSSTSSYSLTIPVSSTTMSMTATSHHPAASMTFIYDDATTQPPSTIVSGIPFKINLVPNPGDTILNITTVSEDRSQTSIVIVMIHKLSDAAVLQSLSSPQGASTPPFTPKVTSVSLVLANNLTALQLVASPSYPLATLSYSSDSGVTFTPMTAASVTTVLSTLPVGDSLLIIRVTSEDGSSSVDTTVHVHRLNAESRLQALSVMDATSGSGTGSVIPLTPPFQSSVLEYACTLTSQQSSIVVNISAMSQLASVEYAMGASGYTTFASSSSSISDALPIPFGDRPIFIRVTSEDGMSVRIYTIHVHRLCSVATLKGATWSVTSDGSVLTQAPTSFTPTTFAYTITIPYYITQVSLTASVTYPLSHVHYGVSDGDGPVSAGVNASDGSITLPSVSVEVGKSEMNVTVESEDGTEQRTYVFILHRLNVSDSEWVIGDWNACSKLCGVGTQTRSVTCKDRHDGSMLPNPYCGPVAPITYQVCDNNCTTHCEYSAWSSCSTTTGDGVKYRGQTCKYSDGTLTLLSKCTDSCPYYVTACNLDSVYEWDVGAFGACDRTCGTGSQVRSVVCKDAVNGTTVADTYCSQTNTKPQTQQDCYTACTNNYLHSFKIDGAVSWTPSFTKARSAYQAVVPFSMDSASGSATLSDAITATLIWNTSTVTDLLYPEKKRIMCTVISQAGAARQYWVDVQRAKSNIATLDALTPSYGSLTPPFSSSIHTYTITVPNHISTLSMTASKTDDTATIVWSPFIRPNNFSLPVLPAYTILTATVTAQDGQTTLIYAVNVTRQRSSNAQLASFSVSVRTASGAILTLQPTFSPDVHQYNLTQPLYSSSAIPQPIIINVTAESQDQTATVRYRLNYGEWMEMNNNDSIVQQLSGSIMDGWNTIEVQSTAEDGTTIQTFTCTFYMMSSNATLMTLDVDSGTGVDTNDDGGSSGFIFIPPFKPFIHDYSLIINASLTHLSLTPTTASIHASLSWLNYTSSEKAGADSQSLDMTPTSSGSSLTIALPLSHTNDDSSNRTIIIQCVSEDQSQAINYTIHISRLSLLSLGDEEGVTRLLHPVRPDTFHYSLILPRNATINASSTLNFYATSSHDAAATISFHPSSTVNVSLIPIEPKSHLIWLQLTMTAVDTQHTTSNILFVASMYTIVVMREQPLAVPYQPPSAIRAPCLPHSFGPLCSFSFICLDGCITAYSSPSPIRLITAGMEGMAKLMVEGRMVAFNTTDMVRAEAEVMQQSDQDGLLTSFLSMRPSTSTFQLFSFMPPSLLPPPSLLNTSTIDWDEWSWLNGDGSPQSSYHTLELIIDYVTPDDDNNEDEHQTQATSSSHRQGAFHSFSSVQASSTSTSSSPSRTSSPHMIPLSTSSPSPLSTTSPSSNRYVFDFDRLLYYSVSSCLAPGEYKPDGRGGCLPCPDGGVCVGGGRIYPKAGYWSSNEFTVPTKCRIAEACPGVQPANDGSGEMITAACADGYTSTACSSCADDYYMLAGRCERCEGSAAASRAAFASLLMVGLIALLTLSFGVALLSSRALARLVTIFVVTQSAVAVGKGSVGEMSDEWKWLKEIISLLSVLNFDLELLKPGCVIAPFSFIALFWCTLLLLGLAAALFVLATWMRGWVKAMLERRRMQRRVIAINLSSTSTETATINNDAEDGSPTSRTTSSTPNTNATPAVYVSAKEDRRRRLTHSMMILGSIFYLQFVSLQFKGLRCTNIPIAANGPNDDSAGAVDGDGMGMTQQYMNVLVVDNQTECFVGYHLLTSIVIVLTFLLYTFGFPLTCFILLCRSFGSCETSGLVGFLIRHCSFLRRDLPHLRRYRAVRARLSSGMDWDKIKKEYEQQDGKKRNETADDGDVTHEEKKAAMKNGTRSREAQLTAEFNRYVMDSFGYLWVNLTYPHFAFRLTFFALSFFTALFDVFITSLPLRVTLTGCMYAAEAVLICVTLAYGTFFQNLGSCAMYVGQVAYYAFLLGIRFDVDPSSRAFFYCLVVLFCLCLIMVTARRGIGRWLGCMKLGDDEDESGTRSDQAIEQMMSEEKEMDEKEKDERRRRRASTGKQRQHGNNDAQDKYMNDGEYGDRIASPSLANDDKHGGGEQDVVQAQHDGRWARPRSELDTSGNDDSNIVMQSPTLTSPTSSIQLAARSRDNHHKQQQQQQQTIDSPSTRCQINRTSNNSHRHHHHQQQPSETVIHSGPSPNRSSSPSETTPVPIASADHKSRSERVRFHIRSPSVPNIVRPATRKSSHPNHAQPYNTNTDTNTALSLDVPLPPLDVSALSVEERECLEEMKIGQSSSACLSLDAAFTSPPVRLLFCQLWGMERERANERMKKVKEEVIMEERDRIKKEKREQKEMGEMKDAVEWMKQQLLLNHTKRTDGSSSFVTNDIPLHLTLMYALPHHLKSAFASSSTSSPASSSSSFSSVSLSSSLPSNISPPSILLNCLNTCIHSLLNEYQRMDENGTTSQSKEEDENDRAIVAATPSPSSSDSSRPSADQVDSMSRMEWMNESRARLEKLALCLKKMKEHGAAIPTPTSTTLDDTASVPCCPPSLLPFVCSSFPQPCCSANGTSTLTSLNSISTSTSPSPSPPSLLPCCCLTLLIRCLSSASSSPYMSALMQQLMATMEHEWKSMRPVITESRRHEHVEEERRRWMEEAQRMGRVDASLLEEVEKEVEEVDEDLATSSSHTASESISTVGPQSSSSSSPLPSPSTIPPSILTCLQHLRSRARCRIQSAIRDAERLSDAESAARFKHLYAQLITEQMATMEVKEREMSKAEEEMARKLSKGKSRGTARVLSAVVECDPALLHAIDACEERRMRQADEVVRERKEKVEREERMMEERELENRIVGEQSDKTRPFIDAYIQAVNEKESSSGMHVERNNHTTPLILSLPSAIDTTQPTSTSVAVSDDTGVTSVHDSSPFASSTSIATPAPNPSAKSSSIRSTRSLHSLVLRLLANVGGNVNAANDHGHDSHARVNTNTAISINMDNHDNGNDKDRDMDKDTAEVRVQVREHGSEAQAQHQANDTDKKNEKQNQYDGPMTDRKKDEGKRTNMTADDVVRMVLDRYINHQKPMPMGASHAQVQRLNACQRALEEMMASMRHDGGTATHSPSPSPSSSSSSSSSSSRYRHTMVHQQSFDDGHPDDASYQGNTRNEDETCSSSGSSSQLHRHPLLHLPQTITDTKLIHVTRKMVATMRMNRRNGNGTNGSVAVEDSAHSNSNSTATSAASASTPIPIPSGSSMTALSRRPPKRLAPLADKRTFTQPQTQPQLQPQAQIQFQSQPQPQCQSPLRPSHPLNLTRFSLNSPASAATAVSMPMSVSDDVRASMSPSIRLHSTNA